MDDFLIEQATELQLDRSDWKLVKFGDVAVQQKESVDRDNTELTRYVKGEHMGSEDLHLREWGELTDEYLGPAFIRKFEEGDILYGSRRTYLRKVAIAHFDGITSNTTFVIKANEAKIDSRLLPFIMLSEGFAEHSIRNSKGSVNPYINWKDIADYEFLLPPKDQQAQLAELLWAMDEVVEKWVYILNRLRNYRTILHKKHFCGYKESAKTIGDYTNKVGSGVTPKGGSKVYQKNGIRFIRSQNVLSGILSFEDLAFISDEIDKKMSSSRVLKNDVLLNITGASIGRCAVYFEDIKANVNQHVCIIRVKEEELDPILLCEFMNSEYGQNQVQLLQAGGNREGLNFPNIRTMKIPNYTYEEQVRLGKQYQIIENSRINISSKISSSKILHKSLINQIF
jgi:type I restriction enzyme S subunit